MLLSFCCLSFHLKLTSSDLSSIPLATAGFNLTHLSLTEPSVSVIKCKEVEWSNIICGCIRDYLTFSDCAKANSS